jgi:uncharacterized lipoprotein YbaY
VKRALAILAAAAAAVLAGCGHLDTTPEGDPARVLIGAVDIGGAALPPGAVVAVRLVVPQAGDAPLRVLGSQTITDPAASPVAFRIEYLAEDALLRRGLNVEARVSWGGRVRYYNMNGYAVTLGNASDPHRIVVNAVGQ